MGSSSLMFYTALSERHGIMVACRRLSNGTRHASAPRCVPIARLALTVCSTGVVAPNLQLLVQLRSSLVVQDRQPMGELAEASKSSHVFRLLPHHVLGLALRPRG